MTSSDYDDPFAPGALDAPEDEDAEPQPWTGGPGRPYGVYPTPPGLVRDPSMSPEEVARLPATRPEAPAGPSAAPSDAESPVASGPPDAPPDAAPAATDGTAAEGPPEARRESAAAGPAAAEVPPGEAKPLRPRQERFCQLYAVLGKASDAAWQAGYSFPASRNQGYRLLRRPEIQARVAQARRELSRALEMDAEVMLGKLESIYNRALEGGYLNAAARVVEVQARIAGHLPRRAAPPAPANDEAETAGNDEK